MKRALSLVLLGGLPFWMASVASAQVIRGQLLEPDGRPHADARIEIVSEVLLQRGLPYRQRPAPVVVGKSSPRGHFAIDVSDLAPSVRYSLFVVTDAFLDHRIAGVERPAGAEHDVGKITLQPGAPITGTVLDADQRPVADAVVRWFPLPDQWSDPREHAPARQDGWVATTDARGRFALANLPPGTGTLTAAKVDCRVDTRTAIARRERPWDARLTLFPAASLRGVVRDQDRRPVAGARVLILQNANAVQTTPVAITRTDAEGRFVLPRPADSRLRVYVQAVGLQGIGIAPAPGSEHQLEFPLVAPRQVRVRVATADGAAVTRFAARLVTPTTAIPMSGFGSYQARDGGASVPVAARGQYCVEVRATGFAPALSQPVAFGRPGADPQEVVVVLDQGGVVRGRAVDAAGAPLPGARVELRYGSVAFNTRLTATNLNWFDSQRILVTAGADGRFEALRLRPQRYVVVVSHPGLLNTTVSCEVHKGKEQALGDVPLLVGVRVHGTVTWQGRPAAGIRVILRCEATNESFETVSDAQGAIAWPSNLPAGRYVAMAGSVGLAGGRRHEFGSNMQRIELPADRQEFKLDLTLR